MLLPVPVGKGAGAEMNGRIMAYCSIMAQARRMLFEGMISQQDYEQINKRMLEKYKLPVTSLYQDIDLIIGRNGGNITS